VKKGPSVRITWYMFQVKELEDNDKYNAVCGGMIGHQIN
jgi:hypothetical protein